ncbi:Hsp20/alpha crystallin family protein [bacterium]|nr:Hsp20/alpha crystallin family protein [bacterium]
MTLVKIARPRINMNLDNMMTNFFDERSQASLRNSIWRPAMDARENTKNYELAFSLPGFEKDDIAVSMKNNSLTLKAEKAEVKEDEGVKHLAREIARGSYERTIELPENVNADKISAEYKSGILTLSIPKTKEALPKEIPVIVK